MRCRCFRGGRSGGGWFGGMGGWEGEAGMMEIVGGKRGGGGHAGKWVTWVTSNDHVLGVGRWWRMSTVQDLEHPCTK